MKNIVKYWKTAKYFMKRSGVYLVDVVMLILLGVFLVVGSPFIALLVRKEDMYSQALFAKWREE